jgi:hypothetical protein
MTNTDILFALSGAGLMLSTVYCIAECMRCHPQRAIDRNSSTSAVDDGNLRNGGKRSAAEA